ncbi:nSTAND1 domain-containing NTPase [Nitrosomonas communis]|uniref:DUF4062 domain-containing protein n=1 Tax=Nitrosomonas communis TaxID=44574 RepID=A0A1I4T8U4_9PROT|nr:SUMF1/EgtB/PvdO family nonheme iron enzyme [Nitrosomonas communis]SFM73119.1 protein of unknown function [Nitrosomonas communis]
MKVYLSSTLNDLYAERQAVKEALGGECTVVESYIADERSVHDSCLADVAGCDLYIGILGRRYGFIPPGQAGKKRSITELEYEKARECKLPILMFVKDDDEIKSKFHDAVTQENSPELIESFRQRINSGTEASARAAIFKTPEELKSHVLRAYLHYSQRVGKPPPKPIEGRPYPGLRAFLPTESDRFFGRDVEKEALLERLLAHNERFLAVIGPSGSGKSSLVYAGLIPALTTSPVVNSVRWLSASFSPRELGDDPFQPLAFALSKMFPERGWRVPDLARRLRSNPVDIAMVTSDSLGQDSATTQLLLFIDQFEEVFAAKVDSHARNAFFQLIITAASCPLLRVVIGMRSDFYSQWPQDETTLALLRSGHFPVGVPGQAALEKMIVGPAQAAGLTIKSSLVQRILQDTGTAPGALALAEFALSQLYDRKTDSTLTEDAYSAIGGVAGAIDRLAEDAVKNAENTLAENGKSLDEETFSRLFLAIASVEQRSDEENEAMVVVRRRAVKDELSETALVLGQHLVDQRILVSRQERSDQLVIYEVGHEAVFNHWYRFKEWYARYDGDLALRRQAEQAARDWDRNQHLSVLKWGWERQKPALEALRKLNHLAPPVPDPGFTDSGIAIWRTLEPQLHELLRRFLYPEPLALLDELNTDNTPHQRREEINLRLNQLGDPRCGVGLSTNGLPDIVWIDIPPGEVTLETDPPIHFPVSPFRLARYPITQAQYRVFLDTDDGYCNPAWWEGRPREDRPGQRLWSFANYPAINVSWYDALAYCRWLSTKLSLDIRLPTEWEWQWAAVSDTQQDYGRATGIWRAQTLMKQGLDVRSQ